MFFKKQTENTKTQNNDDKIKVDTSTITTMIGADTVFEGTINTKASIRINGTVKGQVKADGIVILTKSGHIEGTIEAESIIVAGRIDGNMSIRDKVNVEPSGQIYGEIITKKFVNDEESVFEGNVVMNRDGKVMPVTPYKTDSQIAEEKRIEKEIKEKAEKLAKEIADKKAAEKAEKEEKKDDKSDDKDKDKDSKDDKNKDKDKKDDNKDKSDSDKQDESDSKDKDSDKKDDNKDGKDSEIIIADINEIKDGEDIPKTEVKSDDAKKNSNIKKSKSLSVEVQDE